MTKKSHITTDNIFADLGLEDAEELKIRSELLMDLSDFAKSRDFNKKHLSAILKISVQKADALLNGKINKFTNIELMRYLLKLKIKMGWSKE